MITAPGRSGRTDGSLGTSFHCAPAEGHCVAVGRCNFSCSPVASDPQGTRWELRRCSHTIGLSGELFCFYWPAISLTLIAHHYTLGAVRQRRTGAGVVRRTRDLLLGTRWHEQPLHFNNTWGVFTPLCGLTCVPCLERMHCTIQNWLHNRTLHTKYRHLRVSLNYPT